MANNDNPNGFRADGAPGQITNYETAASQTIAIGDMVTLDASSQVIIATSTSDNLLGMAASSVSASSAGDNIAVYDHPDQAYIGQCSGTYAITLNDAEVDLEGTTGIMEINENASLKRVLRIERLAPQHNNAVGANAEVRIKINRHRKGRDVDAATVNFGAEGLKTDAIAESTSAAGVTIDSVLLKGGEVDLADDKRVLLGSDDDLAIKHSGSNAVITNTTGEIQITQSGDGHVIIDNQDADKKIIARLGTDTNATAFEIQNNSESALIACDASGQVDFSGNVDANAGLDVTGDVTVSGHSDGQILITNSLAPVDTADWITQDDGSIFLTLNKAGKKMLVMCPGLKVGDEVVSFRILGAVGATGGSVTDVDADFRKNTKGAGSVGDASVGAIAGQALEADTALDVEKVFGAPEVVAADTCYYILVTVTTPNNAANDCAIIGAELTVNRKV